MRGRRSSRRFPFVGTATHRPPGWVGRAGEGSLCGDHISCGSPCGCSVELPLLQCLVADEDRPVSLAAVQCEGGADLVEAAAVVAGNGPGRDQVLDLNTPCLTAVPVVQIEDA